MAGSRARLTLGPPRGLPGSLVRALLGPALALGVADVGSAETVAFGGAQPSVRWAIPLGAEDRDADEVDGIAIDPSGNVVATGVFRGGLALGGTSFQSFGEGDIFLASYSVDGGLNWARQLGAQGDDNAFDLAVDGAGNLILSGWFSGSVDFGGATLTSQGATDMVVAKYRPDGGLLWARSFGGAAGDGGNEVAVTSDGEIAVSMITEGPTTIDGTPYPAGGGERDSYVLRLGPDGGLRWVAAFNGPGTERIRAMTINDRGEVWAGFQYRGTIAAAGQALPAAGDWDGAVVKLGSDGTQQWALPVAGDGEDNVRGLAASPDGAVYVGGIISGAGNLLGQAVPAIGRRGDDYLVRLSGSGGVDWIVSLAGPGQSVNGPEVRADARGVVASTSLQGRAALRRNSETLAEVEPPGGRATSVLAAFGPDGQPRFLYMARPAGRRDGALGDVLALSRDGRLAVQALRFRGGLDVEGRGFSTAAERDSAIVLLDLNGS